jgi:class 3 adenylate cyclase
MSRPAVRSALPPVDATTMVIDLRNFTPNLEAAGADAAGVNTFCHFLASFYAECLECCLLALPEALREEPPLYISSTGDGMLIVFHSGDWHFGHGYLAALILHSKLTRTCSVYNEKRDDSRLPMTGFGIGIESGTVCRVHAEVEDPCKLPLVNTYIGECINTAARAEAVSKQLYRARTIVCPQVNRLLCDALLGVDYRGLELAADSPLNDDVSRLANLDSMAAHNQHLCLTFMHLHRLRGLGHPLPLFRLSESAASPGNPRYERLLSQLVRGDSDHLAEVMAGLCR